MRQLIAGVLALLTSTSHAVGLCDGWNTPPEDEQAPKYSIFVSPHTHHWTHNPAHRQVLLAGVSRLLPDNRECGISLFTNSFGQPSAYVYLGKTWPEVWAAQPKVYLRLTAGILYGYTDEYKNKVPLNVNGFSPALIPAVGYQIDKQSGLEIHVLGTAALMFGWSRRF